MSNGDVFAANHRCPKRLFNTRILRDYQKYGIVYTGWQLFHIEPDFEWSVYVTRNVSPIWYCPFCGKKLEGENTNGKC